MNKSFNVYYRPRIDTALLGRTESDRNSSSGTELLLEIWSGLKAGERTRALLREQGWRFD
jgi:hypothetical protein